MVSLAIAQALRTGCEQLGLTLDAPQQRQLLEYLALFIKWNQAYNLSAIRDPEQMLRLHLLDSLSIAPYLTGQRFIDVGTGGGLPGIPLAICFPERHFTLLDSAGKKMRFLFQVKQSLKLANVDTQNCRVEAYQPAQLYDGVDSGQGLGLVSGLQDNQAALSLNTGHCKGIGVSDSIVFCHGAQLGVRLLAFHGPIAAVGGE